MVMREYRNSIKGMYTFVNRSSDDERSDKSLQLAENCTMRRPGCLEARDGVQRSAAMAGASGVASVMLPCPKEQNAALISFSGTGNLTRYTPSTDTWTAYTSGGGFGDMAAPYGDFTFDGSRVLAAFADGVVEIGKTSEPYYSGVEPGKWYADISNPRPVALNGGTWLANNSYVSFKVTYVFKTFNGTWEEGPPSTTMAVGNTTGGTRGVTFHVAWPKTANVSGGRVFRVRVYATSVVASTTVPNDAYYYLFYESQDYTPPQSTFATIATLTTSNTQQALYTNADQSGAGKGRFRPPNATTIKSLGDLTFYTGFAGRGRPSYQVTPRAGFEAFWTGSPRHSVTATFALGNATVNLTAGTVTAADVGLSVAQGGTANTIPWGTTVLQINTPTQFVMTNPAGANSVAAATNFYDTLTVNGVTYSAEVSTTPAAGYTAIGLDIYGGAGIVTNSALMGLAERINSDSGNAVSAVAATVNLASSLAGTQPFAATSLLIESDVPSSALTVTSTNSTQIDIVDLNSFPSNQVLYSEPGLPYAVPLLNLLTVGSPNSKPSGIGVYKEVAYIFQMGRIYSLTGSDESSLSLIETDQDYYVQSQQGIMAGELGCYAYSNKGIIRVGQGGVEIISNMVTDLLPYWGTLAYDKEHRELICIPNSTATASGTTNWMVYSERTGMWTKMVPPLTTPGAMPSNFKVIQCWEGTPLFGEPYLAYSDTALSRVWVQPERTVQTWDSFTGTLPTFSAWSSPTLTVSSTTGLAPGYVIAQTNGTVEWAVIEAVVSSTVLTVRTLTTAGPGFGGAGALRIYAGFQSKVRFQPFDMTDASNTYAFTEVQLLLQRHAFDNSQLIFQTDLSTATESLDLAETGEVNAFWRLRKFDKTTASPLLAPQDDYDPYMDWGGRWLRALVASNGRQGSQLNVEWDVNCAFQRWRLLGIATTGVDEMAPVGRRTGA